MSTLTHVNYSTMRPKEFFDQVAAMRDAQREYFKTRSTSSLAKAKRLEEVIDREILRVKVILDERERNQPIQQILFGNTND